MMKSGLSGPFLLLLLLLLLLLCTPAVSGLGQVLRTHYDYYKDNHRTWEEAQTHCRGHYNRDLAIVFSQADTEGLPINGYNSWIGLVRDAQDNWHWSNGDGSNFRPWAYNHPHHSAGCAYVTSDNVARFRGKNCDSYYFFICRKPHGGHFDDEVELQSKTWLEAQTYSRTVYNDLSTFRTSSDLEMAELQEDFPIWTGLHKDEGAWKWSRGLSEYRGWSSNEPRNNIGACASMSSVSKKMSATDCNLHYPVLCYWDNLVVVKESKTWEEALEHCRALGNHELVSVQPGPEHSYMTRRVIEADTDEVWTGLRFLAGEWFWVNGADLLYPDLPVCPLEQQHCGTLSKQGSVEIRNCSETRNFLCYF